MNDKPFKSHDELLELLESRGIDFSEPGSKSFAKKKLQRIGYYNLINGYGSLFLEEKDKFKSGTMVNEIYNLYLFDQKLREIFLHNILPFEANIKSLIAYHFPQEHPETHYLTYENFDTTRRDSSKNITALIAEIQRQISSRVSDPSIEHYLNTYGYLPLWVLNNILTLGTISKFYSLMKQNERQTISKIFRLSDNELESILTYVSSVRNFSAHGNRLFCYRSKRPLCNTRLHSQMGIERNLSGEYICGKRDLFAVMICLKLTLSKKEFRRLVKDIDIAIRNLSSRKNVLSPDELLSTLGFPVDWKDKLLMNN